MIADSVSRHYEHLYGKPDRRASYRTAEHGVGVWKWEAARHPDEVNFYATVGASERGLPDSPSHHFEFFIGLLPAEDQVAGPLAEVALHQLTSTSSLDRGHVITLAQPLWVGTAMRTFLVGEAGADLVPSLSLEGGAHVEFLQLIPLFQSELEFRSIHGQAELLRRFERAATEYWDPRRTPLRL